MKWNGRRLELTDQQRRILDGAEGPFLATCMRWLAEWGDAMGARRLVPVANTYALVTAPGNLIGDAGGYAFVGKMERKYF